MKAILARIWSGIGWAFRSTWFVPLLCLVLVGQWALMVAIFCGGPSTSLFGSWVLGISGISAILGIPLLGLWFISSCFLKQSWAARGVRLLCAVLSGWLSFGILTFCVLAMMFQDRDHTADNWRVPEGIPFEVPEKFCWVDDKAPAHVKQLAGKENDASPYNFKTVEPLPDGDFRRRAEHLERLAQEHPELLRAAYRRAEILGKNNFIFSEEDDGSNESRPWIRCCLQLHGPGTTIRATDDATLGISHRLDAYRHDLGNGWYLSLTVEDVAHLDKKSTKESVERLEGYAMQRFDAAFAALAAAPTAETLDALLPLPSPPRLHLVQGFQPGMYDLSLFLPQDARTDGHYEIRAYEYESGEELSIDNQAKLNPAEAVSLQGAKVLTKHDFMVYTGDWGQYYGSRWQVWFVPNKGEREKVCEQLFLMQGWMR